MSNKYCNLPGADKISETFHRINDGFDLVEADVTAINARVDNIITTPIEGTVAAQEVVDARGNFVSLGARLTSIDSQLEATNVGVSTLEFTKAEKDEIEATNKRIDELIIQSGDANVEVTDAHVSTIKNKTFSTLRERLEEDEKELRSLMMPMTNLIEIDEDEISFTATSQGGRYTKIVPLISGHKYFYKIELKSDSELVRTAIYDGEFIFSQYHSGSGEYETIAGVFTAANTTESGQVQLMRDDRDSDWTPIYARYQVLIDLTETFGVGNEPGFYEINEILSVFNNHYFKGTESVVTGKRLLRNEQKYKQQFPATNFVINGDFKYGSSGWRVNTFYARINVQNKTLQLVGNGETGHLTVYNNGICSGKTGDKIYYRTKGRFKNSDAYNLRIELRSSDGVLLNFGYLNKHPIDEWATISGIYQMEDDQDISVALGVSYPSKEISDGKVVEFQKVFSINLTETFGKGNEPTLIEFEEMLERFPDSWFDGTVSPFFSVKEIYSMIKNGNTSHVISKAQKVTLRDKKFIFVPYNSNRLEYTGSWNTMLKAAAINKEAKVSGDGEISLEFCGNHIVVVLYKDDYSGLAEIIIDGESQGTVDAYTGGTHHSAVVFHKNLEMGDHVITVKATGEKNEESGGSYICFDHFVYGIGERYRLVEPQRSGVIITFDDARCANTLEMAAPKLSEYGFTATCFVNPKNMGTAHSWAMYFLKDRGFEIASHSWDHIDLTTMTEGEVRESLRKSVEWLKSHKMDTAHFAPPYNAVNSTVLKVIKEFHQAYVTGGDSQSAFYPDELNPFGINRYGVSGDVNMSQVKAVLDDVKENNKVICLMFHGVYDEESVPSPNISKKHFDEIIDYMGSIGLHGMSLKEFLPY